jgi:hypothetical protein
VKVAGVQGEVSLSSSGGPVEARDVRGPTRLTSSGGGITAQAIDGTLFVDTSGGPASIDTVSGELTASSSGGGVRVAARRGASRPAAAEALCGSDSPLATRAAARSARPEAA